MDMNKTLVEQLSAEAERRSYGAGEIIIGQGSRADAFFVLLSGTVDVSQSTEAGDHRYASSLEAPAFFGEVGLMEDGRRTATIRAAGATSVEVLVVSKDAFKAFVDASEMMADEVAALLQKHRIHDSLAAALGDLSADSLNDIAAKGEIRQYMQGDKIIFQGDPAEDFYILTRGRVEVLHQREDGRAHLINFHDPGEYFGEIGLLQNRRRSATVRAADEVEVLVLDRQTFQELLDKSNTIEAAVSSEAAKRIARLVTGDDH